MIDEFYNGLPCSARGAMQNHFVSGRMTALLAPHGGLRAVAYAGGQPRGHETIFKADEGTASAFQKLMRLQLLIDGKAYYPEFTHTQYYPFGFRSECTQQNVRYRHELVLDQDTLFQRIQIIENPEQHQTGARILFHTWCWASNYPDRTHTDWSMKDGNLTGQLTEGETTLGVCVSCNCPHQLGVSGMKYYMTSEGNVSEVVFSMSFGSGINRDYARINQVFEQDRQLREKSTVFETGSAMLDSALNNAIPMLDALRIRDYPGAVRASQSYWVWGWDSMVHAEAYLWSGHTEIVRDMLRFYRETADQKLGVGHAFSSDFQVIVHMKICAQGLYVILLYNYYAATGDLQTVQENIAFANTILTRCQENRHPDCALGRGRGYFPDCPKCLEQENEDIALINNSLYLQALRAASGLFAALGMQKKSEQLTGQANTVQEALEQVLWDDQAGYWCDSARGADLRKRPYHPVYGQLYTSAFGTAPHTKQIPEIAAYMKKHFLFPQGLYMYVPDEPGFMADGNQLGAYYPPVDRYYWNIMNRAGCSDAEQDFQRIVAAYWRTNTYPEGLTHETENEDPTVDNPGCKQAFTMKGWFCDAIELNLGLQVEADGFSCNPLPSDSRFTVRNLVLRGKQLTFERRSDGVILLNGRPLSPGKHSWAELAQF